MKPRSTFMIQFLIDSYMFSWKPWKAGRKSSNGLYLNVGWLCFVVRTQYVKKDYG